MFLFSNPGRFVPLYVGFAIFLLFGCESKPPIAGLWVVSEVSIGDQQMTPIGKWTELHEEGTFRTGNGWMQNSKGIWSWDAGKNSISVSTENSPVDPFGPFTLSLEGEQMLWSREEEGRQVTVRWERIDRLPEAPADQIQGLWDLVEAEEGGNSVMEDLDPSGKRHIFFGWDRIYRQDRTPEGRQTGFWHMDGHRPWLTLIPHDDSRPREYWQIEFEPEGALFLKKEDSGAVRKYVRLDRYPE